ncbi:MAG: MFS transporter [Alphaproteobacteria bacterium]|nr:MFS transporter [Alphaproteobacteria bacterium]
MSSAITQTGGIAPEPLELQTIARVKRRMIPLLFLCYYAAYLDRVNVGFSALQMNKALGLTAAAFGLGGGIFFVGYFLAEIPSNLILERVGARVWIARILLSWGIISGLTALVWSNWSFFAVRFLLGIAEAGFYPGIILFLTWWFPSAYRARMIALFMMAIPVAVITGSWASGFILGMGGIWGLAGWQWLFIIEALPAVILGVVVYFTLTDRPEQAHWLTEPQRKWLSERLAAERAQRERIRHFVLGEALRNGRVWALTLVYFGQNVTSYGFVLFLPQIVKQFGLTNVQTGFVSALPFIGALVGILLWARASDLTGARSKLCGASLLISAALLISCLALQSSPVATVVVLIFFQVAASGIAPTFWPLPTAMLTGSAAAGGIALINSVGNLGGFLGPYAMGLVQDATGSFPLGLLTIAMGSIIGGLVVLLLGHDRRLERATALAAD